MSFRTLRSKCALLITVCLFVLGAAERAAADSVTLEWDPTGSGVGYRVHVGVQSGAYSQHVDVGSAQFFTLDTAVAGQRYCFAVSSYLLSSQVEGPNSAEVCGYSNAPPTLANPGNRTSTVGQAVTLQLVGSDPASQPLTYSATGLPPGLTLMGSTGYISGAGTTAGTYSVTAQAFDGVLTASQTFTWVMSAPAGDTTVPTATINAPTTGTAFSTTASTIGMGGTASDNVNVTQVRWSSDRGGSGVATGTTNWSISSLPLLSGANVITVTAVDAAGNQGTDSLTVTYTSADTTLPTATINAPTTGTAFSTTASTIGMGGTASDNVNVTQVRWSSNRGGSGVATGTTNWSISGVPLQSGANVITIAAVDAAGNQGADALTVTYTVTTSDTTLPTVSISTPTSNTYYSAYTSTVGLGGAAADNVGVTQVRWSNDRGGTGVATGTTNWSISGLPLLEGANGITITAVDAAGNQATDFISVFYNLTSPPPSTVTLKATLRRNGGQRSARLTWSNAPWPSVDVYRNGMLLTNTSNDGLHTDPLWSRGTYTYRICEPGSTTNCSTAATVSY
jgi:Putative Ig domain